MGPEDATRIIDDFFYKDGAIEDGFERKSLLLQILKDLQFNLGIGREGWVSLSLTNEQIVLKRKMLPLLTPVLLFCSAVDLLARVNSRRISSPGENGRIFKNFLSSYFGFSSDEAEIFWEFRCMLSHQYAIPKNVALLRAGSHNIIEKVNDREFWFIYVHSMYTTLTHVKEIIRNNVQSGGVSDKIQSAEFIKEHGFIKQPVQQEIKTAN